jgi:hypothetical protein
MKNIEQILLSKDFNSDEVKDFELKVEDNKGALFLDKLDKVN